MAKAEQHATAADTAERKPAFHWWEREFFIREMGTLLEKLKADESLVPCIRLEKDAGGVVRVWHYPLATGAVRANGDDEGFDQSSPCPPLCPPGYP